MRYSALFLVMLLLPSFGQAEDLPWKKAEQDKKIVVTYEENQIAVPDMMKPKLKEFVDLLKDDTNKRLLIRSYAANSKDRMNAARRFSLKRAINIRQFFVDQGVNHTQISVQALGNQANDADVAELVLH